MRPRIETALAQPLFLLPLPTLTGPADALTWLENDARPLFLAAATGLRHAGAGAAEAVFDALLTDVSILMGYAVRVARTECAPKPELSLEPGPEASFAWVTDQLEQALDVLAFRPDLDGDARHGLTILVRTWSERRRATSAEARASLVLPRGRE